MTSVLLYPRFDPVIVQLGPFGIRWYALAYITGLVLGWRLMRRLVLRSPPVATPVQVDDFLTWATLGVVLGGRLGYVLFYQPQLYFAHPALIFAVWEGGMSFHGGMLGVAVAIVIFCRRNRIPLLGFADRIAVCAPIGLGLGRIANFINGELWGRPAPLWWPGAMVFPNATPAAHPSMQVYDALRQTVCAGLDPSSCVPRYPSELYEATLEGLVLFCVMFALARSARLRARLGWLTGAFLVGYGIARITGECFREPDAFLGFLPFGTTMGQLLCIPMLFAGAWLIWRARPAPDPVPQPARSPAP
ncbi:MAG TPA: prolipoprotein diacylglyceryl transferase [Acetobacteraceae bacterium]|nr:prolipoprotein diacylglyceryl transferase [Acetobacteraceae bacterium]